MPDIANSTATDTRELLKRKIGPVPVWGWGIVFVGATGAFIYMRKRAANGSQGASGDRTIAVQPNDLIGPYSGSSGGGTTIGGNDTGGAINSNVDWTAFMLAIRGSLDALVKNTAPKATQPTTPTPPVPTPATTPPYQPTVPTPHPNNGAGVPATQVPPSISSGIINGVGGALGIPQTALTNPNINTVRLTAGGLHVNDLEGWTAWAPPSNIPAFSGAPSDSYSTNPSGYQQWAAGEYIPQNSIVVLIKNGASVAGFQPRAA